MGSLPDDELERWRAYMDMLSAKPPTANDIDEIMQAIGECRKETGDMKMSIGLHHYITKYVNEDGERYVEAWIQVDFLCWNWCLSKRRVVIGRAAKLHQFDGISTCDLVNELSERDGVGETIIAPHASANVKINGPARLLAVID